MRDVLNHVEFCCLQIWLGDFQRIEKAVYTATSSSLQFPSSLQDLAFFRHLL